MYLSIEDFRKEWEREAMLTQEVLEGLTEESLYQQVYPEGRSIGRIAWHLTTSIPEYLSDFGLVIDSVEDADTVPASARKIAEVFKETSTRVSIELKEQWTDDSLSQVQDAFGREESNATILMGLMKHIVHHRGQITVLMRQAGLKPFGVYGPPKEDWGKFGVENPPL